MFGLLLRILDGTALVVLPRGGGLRSGKVCLPPRGGLLCLVMEGFCSPPKGGLVCLVMEGFCLPPPWGGLLCLVMEDFVVGKVPLCEENGNW